jgi:hypothetical protein
MFRFDEVILCEFSEVSHEEEEWLSLPLKRLV